MLKNEPDVFASKKAKRPFGKRPQVLAQARDAPFFRPLEPCNAIQQRGLAGTRFSEYRQRAANIFADLGLQEQPARNMRYQRPHAGRGGVHIGDDQPAPGAQLPANLQKCFRLCRPVRTGTVRHKVTYKVPECNDGRPPGDSIKFFQQLLKNMMIISG